MRMRLRRRPGAQASALQQVGRAASQRLSLLRKRLMMTCGSVVPRLSTVGQSGGEIGCMRPDGRPEASAALRKIVFSSVQARLLLWELIAIRLTSRSAQDVHMIDPREDPW